MRVVVTGLDGVTRELGVAGGCWNDRPSGDTVDLSGFVSLPGLADAHAHLSQPDMTVLEPGDPAEIARRAFAAVAAGVFLVFDKGWCDEGVLTLTDRPPSERPHLQAAGRIIAGADGYFPGFATEVDDAGLAAAVAAAVGPGGWVKVVGDWPRKGRGPVANFGEGALATAVEVAHAAGARVAIHTMARDVPSIAVRAGVDSVEHGLYLTDDDVVSLGARGGMWVPTILQMEAVMTAFGPDRTAGRVIGEGLGRVRALLPEAQAAGVKVLTGTDLAVPSDRVAREAIRLVDYGLTPDQAVAAVSDDPLAGAGLTAGFAMGRSADVVSFAVDPCDDITTLLEPVAVVRAGRLLRGPG